MVATDVIVCCKIGVPGKLRRLIQISTYVFNAILTVKEM